MTLNENNYVVQEILDNRTLDEITKTLAVSELLTLAERGYTDQKYDDYDDLNEHWFDPHADDIDDMFEWKDSELGVDFWANIQDTVFDDSRSC